MDDKFFKLDQIGETLRQGAKRWQARYDPTTGAWRLLDLWHEALIPMSPNDSIPDDSPAIRVLQADAFEALLAEAQRLGVLSKWVGPTFTNASVEAEPFEPDTGSSRVEEEPENRPRRDNAVALRALGSIERIVALDSSRRLGEER